MNLGSNSVANTLPAGGALAMGVSWAMLSSWGVNTADYVLYTLVWRESGGDVLARLGLPVLALLVLLTATQPGCPAHRGRGHRPGPARGRGGRVRPAAALRVVRGPRRAAAAAPGQAPAGGWPGARPRPASPTRSASFRNRAWSCWPHAARPISASTAASQLALWLVLLACLRGVGLSQAQVPWQTSLAAFAFVRLLTALPITPGGLGLTELGLVGILAGGADHRVSAQVTAGVLLYRAVACLPPIPLGALACLAWRHAPRLIRRRPPQPVALVLRASIAARPGGEPPASSSEDDFRRTSAA